MGDMSETVVEIRTSWWLRPTVAVWAAVSSALCAARLMKASTAFGATIWLLKRGVEGYTKP